MVATPLPASLVERLAAVDPRLEILWDPDLVPAPRYPSDHEGERAFRRDAEAEERWSGMLARAEVVLGVPGERPEGLRELLARAPRLRWVQAMTAGAGELVRRADLSAEDHARVRVTTTSGVHAGPLAEWCILGLLHFAKRVPALERERAARRWPDRHAGEPPRELGGQTMLVIGLGDIGLEAARLGAAFGMRVVGVKRTPAPPPPGVEEVHGPDRLVELAAQADALVVTLPLTAETEGLVSRAVLDAAPADAVLVNVGRGAVVDEAALVDHLRAGTLAGAALDVVTREPLPADSPLWELPNVLLSPHLIAMVAQENDRIVELFADNLRRYLDGRALHNEVVPGVFY
jgi:phosphoglycerate dehydrogenase-like enzyme